MNLLQTPQEIIAKNVQIEMIAVQKQIASTTAALAAALERSSNLGVYAYREFLNGNASIEDLTTIASKFSAGAVPILGFTTAINALGNIKDVDPVVFAANLDAYVTANSIDEVGYATRFSAE